MKTQEKPSSISGEALPSIEQRERFGPPGSTSLAELTDGRAAGEFRSTYPGLAWAQIAAEFFYLTVVLLGAMLGLFWLAKASLLGPPHEFFPWLVGDPLPNGKLALWITVGLSGVCGGSVFSLKWLYHTVAKKRWHRDRIVWRLVVPLLSSVLSIFTGMMITSGLVPFFSETSLTNLLVAAGFGFFVGLFSDNVIAALQRLAHRTFGTVNQRGGEA